MKALDFLILGAQKSGTTTLFQLLSEHPGVFVPPGKEVPFFTRDDASPATLSAYLQEHFGSAPANALTGKVTPHYLSDPRVPARLRAMMPDTRLAVILRNPVERALSHYRMSVRRGLETRDFAQAVDNMLAPADLEAARGLPTGKANENRTYVVWGEYGRLLAPYADQLAQGRMLVLFTRDLESDPAGTMTRLLTFLGLRMASLPSLGQKLHQGGERERLPLQRILRRIGPIRRLWRSIPERHRSRILFGFNQWNVVPNERKVEDMPPEVIEKLREHYIQDTRDFMRLTGLVPPWADLV